MATDNNQYAIETFSLTKIFPDWWGRSKVVAVDSLDLKIKTNEVYGLLGPNGSGKTTTLKMLLSLLHPTKGKSLILGGDSKDSKVSSKVGYLPEESYLYKHLSATETLDFFGRIFSLPRAVRKARIDSLLEMVGLTAMANRPVGTFSKGMARRIGLAQALINDPEVLILDEPTSGMDPIGTHQMKELIKSLANRGKTILLCSHLLADVEDVCDRIGILYGGKMQQEGPVNSLLEDKGETQILADKLSDQAIAKIQKIIEDEKSKCQVTAPMVRLEEFFVNTVANAQKQQQPTSGAVSSTGIESFLTENPEQPANVLDDLVSASVNAQPEEKAPSAKPVTQVELTQKSDLLQELTKTAPAVETTKTESTSKSIETDVQTKDDIKDDILKGLMGNDNADGSTEPATDKSDQEQNNE